MEVQQLRESIQQVEMFDSKAQERKEYFKNYYQARKQRIDEQNKTAKQERMKK